MSSPAPSISRSPALRRVIITTIAFVLGLVLALACDAPALDWMRQVGFPQLKLRFEPQTWWRAGYMYGTLWIWACITLVVIVDQFATHSSVPRGRLWLLALLPLAAAALGGGLADALKPFLCRMRPEHALAPALYHYADFLKNFPNGSGLGLPSSHAAVAAAGATGLWLLYPRWGWIAGIFAMLTCASRVAAGAHYPSDVYVGAWTGYASALILARFMLSKPPPRSDQPAS